MKTARSLAVAAVTAGLLVAAGAATARGSVSVNVGIGLPFVSAGVGYGHGYGRGHGYHGGGWGRGWGSGVGVVLAAPIYGYGYDRGYGYGFGYDAPVIVQSQPIVVERAAAPVAMRPDPVIYPRNGQDAIQTEADRQQCNRWATTQPAAVADAAVFQRAVEACMDGRGYTVR